MKKVGILTFHRAHNYGAVLQAYALQECLKGLGYDVSFINHKNKELLAIYKVFNTQRVLSKNPIRGFKNLVDELKVFKNKKSRAEGFDEFLNDNLREENNIDYQYLNENYDFIFIGSDQVWNYKLTRGFDEFYWGIFKNKNSKLKLISYAASMEISDISIDEKKQITKNLENFDHISVREDSLKDKLQDLTKKDIFIAADPTLIVDVKVWDAIAKKPNIEKPYLLLYQVRNNANNESLAKRVAEKFNLEIVYLSARIDANNSDVCISASPADYLGLFKYASFVVCSSFHGTVFSVLFQKPFYSILMNDGKDSRSVSFLKSLNLETRAKVYDAKIDDETIEWDRVSEKLVAIKEASTGFVNNVLR